MSYCSKALEKGTGGGVLFRGKGKGYHRVPVLLSQLFQLPTQSLLCHLLMIAFVNE